MKKYTLYFIIFIFLLSSCKKSKRTTCSATLYGFNGILHPSAGGLYDTSTGNFGVINETTGTASTIATFTSLIFTNQGAYNTSDNCYYTLNPSSLVKVSTTGTVTTIPYSGTYNGFQGLLYNQFSNKLFAMKLNTGSGTGTALVEIILSGASFTDASPVSTLGTEQFASPVSTTVDNATGNIYYSLSNISSYTFNIEKYAPGATTPVLVTSISDGDIIGLQFNKTDNMLYAIKEDTTGGQQFIRIDPGSGAITAIATVSGINNEFYSTAIDPCSNQYLVTSMIDTGTSTFGSLTSTGTVTLHDTVAGIIQGMAIAP